MRTTALDVKYPWTQNSRDFHFNFATSGDGIIYFRIFGVGLFKNKLHFRDNQIGHFYSSRESYHLSAIKKLRDESPSPPVMDYVGDGGQQIVVWNI